MPVRNAQKVLDELHTLVHALRLQQNYKPSPTSQKLEVAIGEYFQDDCHECKSRLEYFKYNPTSQKKDGFFSNMFGGSQ